MNNLYVVAGLSMLITFSVAYHYATVNTLEKKLLKVQKDLADEIVKSTLYKSALDLQSLEIEHLRVDVNTSKTKLEQWKALPTQIRYETIYKYIPKQVILERGDCNDTKMLIDSIRAIDFNSL